MLNLKNTGRNYYMNKILKLLIILLCLNVVNSFAFNETITHRDLTERAFTEKASELNSYLINQLGFKSVTDTKFLQKDMLQWLKDGSTEEDKPVCRAANHFHNPVHTGDWTQSQSTDVWPQDAICQLQGWTPRYSNITWATGLTSSNDTPKPRNMQNMGYDNAKTYFYNALTSLDAATRETLFAKSFQAVGQSLHLLQDMAVPAHVRNDFLSHLIFAGINPGGISNWVSNPFEAYVKKNPNLVTSILPSQIPPFTITGAIVSDFWDTDGRTGAPFLQGLAESTNGGYLSDFTIPGNPHIPFVTSHSFASPQIPTYTCYDFIPGTNDKRKYASRWACPTDGSPVDHLAAISMFTPRLIGMPPLPLPFLNKYVLDDNVHKTYAGELLPKTVGYSAALLDYFFRGKIKLTVAAPDDITFRSIKVTAQNDTTDEDMASGDMSLVIRYKALSETSLGGGKYLLNNPTADYTYKVVTLTNLNLATPQVLTFDLSADPLPYNFSDMTMQLVYKGKLGNEDGAVAVSKPEIIDGIYTDFDLSLPPSGVFAKVSGDAPTATFNEIRITALSNIPGGLSGGTISLALDYRTAIGDQFQSVLVDTEPANAAAYIFRTPEKNGVNALPQGVPVELVFDLSTLQLPVAATDVEINIVYSKADGATQAIGVHDISEPTPVDVYNNTDYTCLNNTWYRYDDPEAMAIVDSNGDGIADRSDIYPHTISNISFLSGPAGMGYLDASVSNTLFAPGPLPTGQLLRLGYILTDYTNGYAFSETRTGQNGDPWPHTANNKNYPGTGFRNDGDTWSMMYTFRGTKMWWGEGVIFINQEYNGSCTWDALHQKLGL